MDLEERLRRALPLIMRQLESIKIVKGNGKLYLYVEKMLFTIVSRFF